jgi:hypothetical protein
MFRGKSLKHKHHGGCMNQAEISRRDLLVGAAIVTAIAPFQHVAAALHDTHSTQGATRALHGQPREGLPWIDGQQATPA